MRKKVNYNILYFFVLTIMFSAVVFLYFEINKPITSDVSAMKVVATLKTEDLIEMFEQDKNQASAILVNKVIEVKGVIKEISFLNERCTVLLNSENFDQSFVMCEMATSQPNMSNLAVGDTLTLKGICKGFLLDVIMLNCVAIDETPKN